MAEILKRRDHTLDAMKAVAIFLVVWGHSIQLLVQIPYKQNPLCLFLYSFHMPWFMALTGYFASSLLRYKPKDAFVKRFRELLLPAIVFTTIYVVFGVYDDGSIKRFIVHQIYDFWFLKSAFVCALLFYLSIYLSILRRKILQIYLTGRVVGGRPVYQRLVGKCDVSMFSARICTEQSQRMVFQIQSIHSINFSLYFCGGI